MRGSPWIPLFAACAWMGSCSEPRLECGADAVTGTLTSLVRDRVLRVAADAYPGTMEPAKRGALARATRVMPREAKLLEWDTRTGRLACVARVIVDAPGPDSDTNLRREAMLRYRVTKDDELFLVEVAYADLMAAFPAQPSRPAGAMRRP